MAKKTAKSYLTSPTQKTLKTAAIWTAAVTFGAALSKGFITVVPEKGQQYAKAIVAGAGLLIAASAKQQEVKIAGVGLAALQLTDIGSEFAKKNLKTTNPFLLAMFDMDGGTTVKTLNSPSFSNWNPISIPENNVQQTSTIQFN